MAQERLQKIIAAAGVTSRRKAEELITSGRVQVNGTMITELGTKADLDTDHIRVDGKLLHGAEKHRYYMVNKPRGYVTTVSDPEGRPTVMQLFDRVRNAGRIYPVGRLDYLSEGLLLMTNDGALANLLTKASTGVEKTYLVKVSGRPTAEGIDQLRRGVMIEKGRLGAREGRVMTAPAAIKLMKDAENPWYEMVLIEGRNRELRKMFEEIGHHVEKIRRVGFGPLILDVPPGELRELDDREIMLLQRATRPAPKKRVAPAPSEAASTSARTPASRTPVKGMSGERATGKRAPAKRTSVKRTAGKPARSPKRG